MPPQKKMPKKYPSIEIYWNVDYNRTPKEQVVKGRNHNEGSSCFILSQNEY
jgi:hypothetical protein